MMESLPAPEVGKSLPLHPTYEADERARRFWRASFRCGRGYLSGPDATGVPVLVAHEREESEGYKRRLRVTKPRNFVGPILRRYNDLTFRKAPVRPTEGVPPFYTAIVEDATGEGEPLDAFMRRALMLAQIDRESWILLDTEGGEALDEAPTVAQVESAGTRPVLEIIPAGHVVNWREEAGAPSQVEAAWAIMCNDAGLPVCRMFSEYTYTDALLDPRAAATGQWIVQGFAPPVVHGYDGVPLVRLRPNFDPLGCELGSAGDSQAGPLAESQQAIVNLLSLSHEEIYNVTFSQMVAFGVSDAQVGEAKIGSNRVLCVPNPSGKVEFIGADPAQAESIRAQITDEAENLFRLAGINPGDATAQAQSGVALAFRHNDLATIVAALAIACEDAEAAIWDMLGEAWGFEPPARTVYQGKDTELPDFAGEAQTMLAVVANTALPPVIRQKVAERFAARNLSLSPDELAALVDQIENGSASAATMGGEGGGAFPPNRPAPAFLANARRMAAAAKGKGKGEAEDDGEGDA